MNTEISINPLTDNDSTRMITGSGKQNTKSTSTSDAPAPKRGRPPLNRQQPTYASIHPKEFVVAPIPTMPVPVSEMEFRHYRRHSPRASPSQMFAHTKIYPPSVGEPRAVDLDSIPYDPLRPFPPHHAALQAHHHPRRMSPPTHRMVKMEPERRSPPRRQRSRSPIYKNGYGREEGREFYYPPPPHHVKAEESKRRHHASPRYYPYEIPPPQAVIINAQPPQRRIEKAQLSPLPTQVSKDQEPTVYVLPEGFDLENDRFDPATMVSPPDSNDLSTKESEVIGEHGTASPVRKEGASPVNLSPPKTKIKEETRRPPGAPTQDNVGAPPGEHKLSCKICKQTFPTKSTLYKHLRGHSSDEKPFKCNECGQGFTLSSNLRQHRIIHRGYKPFQCEYCGKKFMRSNVYKQHRRMHTGESMHKCDLCPSEFLQKYALVKHLKKAHNIETYDQQTN